MRPARWITLFVLLRVALRAGAADSEGCLICHQYRGLSRLDATGTQIRLFFVDPKFHNEGAGPHGRIRCTGCHERAGVEVFPHKTPATPVDCTRTCHLTTPRNVETRFGHDRIGQMLDTSVHTREVLERCNELLGRPVRAGQARCLLCHDEPIFRKPAGADWSRRQAPVTRCTVCHDDRLQIDAPFNYWHVHSRSMPARGNLDLVRVCATCHSDARVKDAFRLTDAPVSYLASFHGKAALLNNQEAASCLDCHVGEGENVHVMHSHKRAGSPTSASQVADTCRAPACHRSAGARISTAAIHLDLPRSRGIEYFIAVLFVLMILSTFGPSMVITLLKLFHMTIGRDDPDHHHEAALAKRLMSDAAAGAHLRRFTVHQRVQHWFLVATFATLVVTGFPMKFADRAWADWVIRQLGGLTWVRSIHRYTGALLLAGFLYHSGYIIYHMRRMRGRTRESSPWLRIFFNLPMVMKPADLKEMVHLMAWLLFLRKERPDGGRFTAEEKFEYFGVFWGIMLLGTTGLVMWFNSYASRFLPGRTLTIFNLVHSFEAFLALLHVGILHMAAVIFSPAVFPISPAMFTGNTPAAELAESHSKMVNDLAAATGIRPEVAHA
jgi:cytochrome b subunit of formate dehydrogenase